MLENKLRSFCSHVLQHISRFSVGWTTFVHSLMNLTDHSVSSFVASVAFTLSSLRQTWLLTILITE